MLVPTNYITKVSSQFNYYLLFTILPGVSARGVPGFSLPSSVRANARVCVMLWWWCTLSADTIDVRLSVVGYIRQSDILEMSVLI